MEGDDVIVISGSRRSGGFGLTKVSLLEGSELTSLLKELPHLFSYQMPEAKTVDYKGRLFCWTKIREGGYITLPIETLSQYGVEVGDILVVGRGSYLSIAFIVRGPILEEALKHPELEVFGG